jgi:hypothetical protein
VSQALTIRIRAGLLAVLLALALLATKAAAQCGVPRIDCPGDIEVLSCSTNGIEVDYALPTAFNDCGPLNANLEFGLPPGAVFPLGTTNVGYWAVDANGSVVRCDFQVTVIHQADIVMTCPEDLTVQACEDGGAIVAYDQPTATSRCGPLDTLPFPGFATFVSGSLFPVGTTNVTWMTDQSLGFFTICSFNVTVLPLIPSMTCPGSITVTTCDPAGAIVDYVEPTGGTACGPLPTFLFSGLAPGSLFPIGVMPVQWAAGPLPDGSFATCIFHVTVELGPDTEPPVVDCPDDIVVVAAPGQSSAVAFWKVAAYDECPGDVTVVSDPPSGSTFPCGTTPVTVIARDATGNESVCAFDVIVALPAPLDIKPGSCPNPLNATEQGILPVAVMGSSAFDIARIDPASVRLEGVAPLRWSREDVGAPYLLLTGKDDCLDCRPSKKDRTADLAFKFDALAVVAALGKLQDRECRVARLTASTIDGCPVVGEDVVLIVAADRAVAATEEAVDIEPDPAPRPTALHPANPNPMTRSTRIAFELPVAAHARLDIYDVSGRRVRTLANGQQAAGRHEQEWDGADEAGSPVAGGIYFHVLTIAGEVPSRLTGKVLVVR